MVAIVIIESILVVAVALACVMVSRRDRDAVRRQEFEDLWEVTR